MDWIKEHLHDDVNELALHASTYPDVDVARALVQIRGWQIAEKKLPLWAQTEGILYPNHLPLEQCSSQLTAEYKASLVGGNDTSTGSVTNENQNGSSGSRGSSSSSSSNEKFHSMTDLTGGFGVDAVTIARQFEHLTYVEQREDLCQLAQHNFPLLGVTDFEVIQADCEEVLERLPHQNLIMIDPARRDASGRKTVAISDCTPDVSQLNQLLLDKADKVMIKLSPMLDIPTALQQMKDVYQLHVVSVQGECKEILVLLNKHENEKSPQIVCADITREGIQRFCFTREDEQAAPCSYTQDVSDYLYEPNASLMKACPFKSLAQHFHLQKLHPNSHLYTSMERIPDFPGRQFRVEDVLPLNKQTTKQISQLGQANISVRNFPATVADLRKRFRLADGGDNYIFATTLADNRRVVILCKK